MKGSGRKRKKQVRKSAESKKETGLKKAVKETDSDALQEETEKEEEGSSTELNAGSAPLLWVSLGTALLFAFFIFSGLSYTLSIKVYIIVPAVTAFIISFLFPYERKWGVAVGAMCIVGSLLFSGGPNPPAFAGVPDRLIADVLAGRQKEMLSFTPPLLIGLLGGALGWGISLLLRPSGKWIQRISFLLLIIFCINFVVFTIDLNPSLGQQASKEPEAYRFNNYNSLNLKTFYLMKKGDGFYRAYADAFGQREETPRINPPTIWNWRTPALFLLWKSLLPADGFYILYLYLLFALGIFILIYNLAGDFLPPPLNLAPVILAAGIFSYGGAAFWFAFPEFWGVCLMFLGIWGVHRKNAAAEIIGFTLALLARELFFLPWLFIVLVRYINRRDEKLWKVLTPGVVFLLSYVYHYRTVSAFAHSEIPSPDQWFRGDLLHVLATFSFGSVLYSGGLLIMAVALVLGIITVLTRTGMLKSLITKTFGRNELDNDDVLKNKELTLKLLAAAAFAPPVLFLVFGPEGYRAYWGIIYLPFIMILPFLIMPKYVLVSAAGEVDSEEEQSGVDKDEEYGKITMDEPIPSELPAIDVSSIVESISAYVADEEKPEIKFIKDPDEIDAMIGDTVKGGPAERDISLIEKKEED